ncbi:uncharacterized protein LOC129221191 [Uloborus diversus]|uniref:uncharacterized protein LOC129221191 n=1 Tax=Uloborus diversus TaxID=327109 RepID=UPI00240A6469|nr:uncharacterized protein LOC129221191 [Uloborus diversus]
MKPLTLMKSDTSSGLSNMSFQSNPRQLKICCGDAWFCWHLGQMGNLLALPEKVRLFRCPLARRDRRVLVCLSQEGNVIEDTPEATVLEKVFLNPIFIPRYHLQPNTVKVFKEKVCVGQEEAQNLASLKQHSDEWFCERRKRITGSTCYSLFTYARNKNPNWKKKVQSITENVFAGNAATAYGNEMEEKAKNIFAFESRVNIFNFGLIVRKEVPWFAYSPDGLYMKDGTLVLSENQMSSKNENATSAIGSLPYVYVDPQTGQYALKPRHAYYGQVQLGMYLTGAVKTVLLFFPLLTTAMLSLRFFQTNMRVFLKH